MTSTAATHSAIVALAFAIGCGESDETGAAAPPEPAAGGGVRGGAIAGKLDVFVIDSTTGTPIAGAEVWLGEGSVARAVGTTDESGRVEIVEGALSGAQTVSARAPGHAAAAWLGVMSAQVTLPLAPLSASAPSVKVEATIAGWDALPAPAPGKYRVARLAASRRISLGSIDAAASAAPAASDTCVSGSPCTLGVEAPLDSNRLLALIAEGDDAGTPGDPSDDTLTATGLALLDGVELSTQSTGLVLEIAAPSSISAASVSIGSALAALFVIGVPGVAVADQVTIYPAFARPLDATLVPVGTDVGALWAMAVAGFADGSSIAMQRGLTPPESPPAYPIELEAPEFFDLPDATPAAGGFELTRAPDAELCALALSGTSGRVDVLVLDDRSSAEPPMALVPEGPVELGVSITDASIDPASFAWADVVAATTRRAHRRRSLP